MSSLGNAILEDTSSSSCQAEAFSDEHILVIGNGQG
jgi:hypothetical protein